MAGKAAPVRAYVGPGAQDNAFTSRHIRALARSQAAMRGHDAQPNHRRARLPGPGADPALGAAAPDREQHRQRRHAGLPGPRHEFREDPAGRDRLAGRRAKRRHHPCRTYRQRQRRLERRQGRRRAALRHRRPDQPRPQHRRHGPRARQLRRQRDQVRGDAALHQFVGADASCPRSPANKGASPWPCFRSSTSPAAPPARRASGSTSSPPTWPTPTPSPARTAAPTRRARSRSRPS